MLLLFRGDLRNIFPAKKGIDRMHPQKRKLVIIGHRVDFALNGFKPLEKRPAHSGRWLFSVAAKGQICPLVTKGTPARLSHFSQGEKGNEQVGVYFASADCIGTLAGIALHRFTSDTQNLGCV